jgi:hypothetical protein
MSDDELLTSIRSYGRRKPFRPYLIEFVSGIHVRVNHPDSVAQFGRLFLYRGQQRSRSLFSSSSVCRLLDATDSPSNTPA